MVDNKKNQKEEALILIKAIDISTKEVIAKGTNTEEVIRKAEESGDDYILDYETDANYNFVL